MERHFESYLSMLQCPSCSGALAEPAQDAIACGACNVAFPIVDGRPVLIDEKRSVFSHTDYQGCTAKKPPTGLRGWLSRLPSPSVNLSAVKSFETMRARLFERSKAPVVLVVGAGTKGKGMSAIASIPDLRLINVDPAPKSAATVLCDGHDLPFRDGSVDAVIVQAVLEHVADPVRCVAEIHRVLVPGGLVYSETPFMQQVHERGYDFTRFTHIGHRRLFRWFTEVESGVVAGPGTALAWSWRYFLASLAPKPLAGLMYTLGRVTGTPFELFDHLLRQRPGAIDGASCTYFLGTRATEPVCDREVLGGYRGARES